METFDNICTPYVLTMAHNPFYLRTLDEKINKIPTAGLEALIGGRFHCLKRSTDNFFVGMGLGRVDFPMRVRLTSISGQKLEAFIPDLKNDFSYPSSIQYSGINVGGSMDLYIAGDGKWNIDLIAVECPTVSGQAGNIQFKFQGSNPWYIKLQVRNSKIPTAGLEALIGNKFHCLKRSSDNFFVGTGLAKVEKLPLRVRLTSISGQKLEAIIPDLKNDISYPSSIQYSGINVGGGPDGIQCFGQGDSAPYPSGGMGSVSYIPSGHKYVFHPGKFFCYLDIDDYVFLALVVTFYIAFPAVVITFCYYQVYKVIKNHNKSMANWGRSSQSLSAQEINITRTLFVIVVMFM
ncbi:hypothetical protein QZH41_012124, partial [Actinostola sp. cb2023]